MELHGGAGLRTPCPGHVSKPVPRPIHTDMALALPRPLPSAISQDFCPHRLAPLSEGRVEADGQLLCAYHGWRFDSTGKCTDLPQAKQPVSEWDSKKIPCAVSYPTMEKHGLLFVWPQAGAEAEAQARATEPRGYPEMVVRFLGEPFTHRRSIAAHYAPPALSGSARTSPAGHNVDRMRS